MYSMLKSAQPYLLHLKPLLKAVQAALCHQIKSWKHVLMHQLKSTHVP